MYAIFFRLKAQMIKEVEYMCAVVDELMLLALMLAASAVFVG